VSRIEKRDLPARHPVNSTGSIQQVSDREHSVSDEPSSRSVARKAADPADALLERAKGIIEVVRARNVTRTALHGRVELGDADHGRILRGYYPALDLGFRLLEVAPDAWDEVSRIADRASAPGDLRPDVRDAAGVGRGPPAEPSEEIGQHTLDEYRLGDQTLAERPADLVLTTEPPQLAICDASVDAVFAAFVNKDLSSLLANRERTLDLILGLVRLYARAKERGVEITVSNWTEITRRLPRTPEAIAVLRRLARELEVDEHLIPWEGRTLAEPYRPLLERRPESGPLGGVTRFGSDPDFGPIAQALERSDMDAVRVDDPTLVRIFALYEAAHKDLHISILQRSSDPSYKIQLLRFCARTREISLPTELTLQNLQSHVEILPVTEEAIDVLRRVCRAFAIEEDRIQLGGMKLSEHPASRGIAAPAIDATLPLGDRALDNFMVLIRSRSDEVFQQSDASILFSLGQSVSLLFEQPSDRRSALSSLRLIDRGLEIGAITGAFIDYYLPNFLATKLEPGLIDDPELMDMVARVYRRSSLDPAKAIVKDGAWLSNHRPYADAVSRLDRRMLEEAAPIEKRRLQKARNHYPALGQEEMPQLADRDRCWAAKDARYFALSDTTLAHFTQGALDLGAWIAHWNDPRVFLFFAHVAEISQPINRPKHEGAIRSYVAAHALPAELVTGETMPWILRMAEAGRISPDSIRVRTETSDVRLTMHPAFRVEGVHPAAEATRIIESELSPASGEADRRAAIVRLLAGGVPIEASELLPALVGAARSGQLSRAAIARAPAEEKASFLREAFAPWSHVGLIAVLAGLLTDLAANDVQALLREKGAPPELATRWGKVAQSIRAASPGSVGYVLADVVRDPERPDFRTLPMRLALDSPVFVRRSMATDAARMPVECARSLIERALLAEPAAPVRLEILAALERSVENGTLLRRELTEAMRTIAVLDVDRAEQWPFYEELITPVLDSLGLYHSAGIDRKDAAKTLSAHMDRLALFAGGAAAAKLVLESAYEADESFVMPLKDAEGTGIDASEFALRRVRELGRAGLAARATPDQRRAFEWIELAIRRAGADEIDVDALVGLAEAFRSGLVGKDALSIARDKASSGVVEEAIEHIRSKDARTLLKNKPTRAALTRASAPARPEMVSNVTVKRGTRAPLRETIDDE
jgi:hypothetical protein